MVTPPVLALIDAALEEDLGRGDVTTEAIFSAREVATGVIVAKQPLILAGVEVARTVFKRVDARTRFETSAKDGQELARGAPIAAVQGSARGLLGAERTALNFLQRLCGIATLTQTFVRAVAGTKAVVLDTRKTLPGWRSLDKAAVRAGGGTNHRADLASGILIKDNHIAACGSVAEALRRARAHAPRGLRIEVEVSTAADLEQALAAGAEIVLLDNVDPATARVLVAQAAGRALIEVSGGVRLETVRAFAEAGVDRISIGALTHSAPAVDLSLEFEVRAAG